MQYWLFKSEPHTWSWDEQVAKGDIGEEWDGVRNYRFGLALGSGHEQDETETVEGKATAKAALKRAQELGLDMPITKAVDDLVSGKIDVPEATRMLMSRPQKEE